MAKVLLAVTESFIEASRTAWNYYVNSNYINPKVEYFDTNILYAKQDAQKMVEEAKREVLAETLMTLSPTIIQLNKVFNDLKKDYNIGDE
jgi:hypothetical protein